MFCTAVLKVGLAELRYQAEQASNAMALPTEHAPHERDGVNERGGSTANTRVAVVAGGKVKETKLTDLAK